jgi:hypothetical protein
MGRAYPTQSLLYPDGGYSLYVPGMRCTFDVDGDLLEPWEELLPEPPRLGSVLVRHGHAWVVKHLTFLQPLGGRREASAWLT